MANSIIAGNDFRLIIRAKKSTGAYLADMDLADVEDLRIYLTRAGRSKVLQSYTLDEEGHAVIYVSAGVVTNATYGIEMVGVYGGARLRAHNTSVFTISGHGGGNSGVLNDYYADIVFVINVAATDVYVQNAIEAHNENEASHPHLLQLIEDAGDVDDVQIDGESIVDENKIAKIDSSQFGKVDDVKVNGTSVVSNKEANITIPEKVSDLPNDADYATQSELTTGLAAKQDTITAVAEPTIADDGGNPSASVNFEGGEMAFAFRNLKLRFSDLTAADKAELKGDKGDQGDSAVYDPSSPDAPDFVMANSTGQSTTKAMTQKAVTDSINSIGRNVEPISNEFDKIPYLATFNGTSSVASCTPIVLQNEGDMLEVEVFIGSISGNAKYALADNGGTSIIFSVTDKSFFARGSDTGRTWMCQKGESLTSSTHFVAKILYDDGKVKFYRDGTLIETYNGQKPMTISRWGLYNNGSTNYYWNGKIGKITIKGQAYNNIGQIPEWSGTNVTIGNSHGFLSDEQYQMLSQVSQIPTLQSNVANVSRAVEPISSEFDKIPYLATFNGTSSVASCADIVLQNEGDFLEIEVWPDEITSNAIFALANNGSGAIRFSVTQDSFNVRADDSTWLCNLWQTLTPLEHYVAKVVYDDGKVKFYRDETLVETYEGQKKVTIAGWGVYTTGGSSYYWGGKIGKLKINGTSYRHIGQIPGWNTTNVSIGASHGFLSDEQYEMLQSAAVKMPTIMIGISEQGYMNVLTKVADQISALHIIRHYVNNTENGTNPNEDMWRVAEGDLRLWNGYTSPMWPQLGKSILVGAENEFAINLQGMGDHIGGYHGNEKVAEEGDYTKFVVDGEVYTYDELVAMGGPIACESFYYEQVSTLYASAQYDSSHPKIGKHYKKTVFDHGFKTTNYVVFDFSALETDTIKLLNAYSGLLCIHKDVADTIVSDIGKEYETTHPSTTAVLASNINKYSRRVAMRNGKLSCQIDSHVLKSSINGVTDGNINNIEIYDRANDAKYYAQLPVYQVDVTSGDYIATECEVQFYYNNIE